MHVYNKTFNFLCHKKHPSSLYSPTTAKLCSDPQAICKKTGRNLWETPITCSYMLTVQTHQPLTDLSLTHVTHRITCDRSRDVWIEHSLLGSGYEGSDLNIQLCRDAQTHNRPRCWSHMSITMTTSEDVSGWLGVSGWFINVWWSELITQRKWAASG